MALRLSSSSSRASSSSSSSSATNAFRPLFDRLVEDGKITLGRKTDAVKTLQVVLKNAVSDPVKSRDPKYRQLKLGNAKLQQRLYSIPVAMEIVRLVGFRPGTVDGEECLVLPAPAPSSSSPGSSGEGRGSGSSRTMGLECVAELRVTQQRLAFLAGTAISSNVPIATAATSDKLSEKQKARKLAEEREREEKSAARADRKRNLALLKADKHARENDPNWKPKVSAACAKAGSGISTFRDKYGE